MSPLRPPDFDRLIERADLGGLVAALKYKRDPMCASKPRAPFGG